MSELKTNKISTNDQNNVAIDNALGLKSYTTTQRDALTSVAGDMIYNTTEGNPQVYDGSAWQNLGGLDAFSLQYLIVGGGGNPRLASGKYGGGGGGGLLTNVPGDNSGGGNSASPAFYVVPGTSYKVEVGASKSISYFEAITAGQGGSSGSGGFFTNYAPTSPGGNGTTAPTNIWTTQGYIGGAGNTGGQTVGGGGGGTGSVGADNSGATGGNGGIGTISTIISSSDATTYSVGEVSGSDVYFGGGGGGAGSLAGGGGTSTGGLGGGGDGKSGSTNAEFGAANTGGGGGASDTGTDGQGGSGVVILKYPDTYTITVGAGLTDATSGGITSGGYTTVILTAGTDTVSWS
jgi:hypothetical protein